MPSRLPAGGVLKEGAGEERLAAGRKDDVDGIVHAARDDGLDACAVGLPAENVGGSGHQGFLIGPFVGLLREGAFAQ